MSTRTPWVAEFQVNTDLAKNLIELQFPELQPLRIELIGEGWDNTVFRVNDQFLFRFPRRQIAVGLLENEARILPKLLSRLPLSIPEITHQGFPTPDFPWPFLGYRYLEGVTGCKTNLSLAEREEMATLLARFLRQLHQVSEAEASKLGAVSDQLGRLDLKTRVPMALDYLNRLTEIKVLESKSPLYKIVDQSISLANTGVKTLLHGDLYIRHLLFNSNRKLTGVIDWGDVHIGNPAIDLSVVFTALPPTSHATFFREYGSVSDETWLLGRFRGLLSALITTTYAQSTGDSDLFREGKNSLSYLTEHITRK